MPKKVSWPKWTLALAYNLYIACGIAVNCVDVTRIVPGFHGAIQSLMNYNMANAN